VWPSGRRVVRPSRTRRTASRLDPARSETPRLPRGHSADCRATREGPARYGPTTDRGGFSAPWRTRSTTSNTAGTRDTFRVTHPYHPLFGREYKLVTYCHGWGSHRVYFHDDAGRLRKISACWTNVVAEDPFVVVAAGRSAFRVADLLMLADVIEVLQPRRRRGEGRCASNVSR